MLAPTETVEGVHLTGLLDIGLMELNAPIDRGNFYDLYAIAQHTSLADLLAQGQTKHPYVRDLALESLVLFDNADRDVPSQTLIPLSWPEVKAFFVTQAQALGRIWFQDQQFMFKEVYQCPKQTSA